MMRIRICVAVMCLFLLCALFSVNDLAAAPQKGELLQGLTEAAKDSVNKADLEALSTTIEKMYKKYNFSDADIGKLGASAVNLVLAAGAYNDSLHSDSTAAVSPRTELKGFFNELSGFLGKYNVTGEDTLDIARDISMVIMGARDMTSPEALPGGQVKKSGPSRADLQKVFARLSQFSGKYSIKAGDLIPIADSISDIALTMIQKQTEKKRLEKTDPDKAKSTDAIRAVSQEQLMGVIQSLMSFQKKYNIDLTELLMLADDIRKTLK
ncbi:MAG: hypothetical protein AB9903_20855 [Vulcanimicrobiota bacterium]